MNFLAHLYLSFDNPGIMVGNFIGDFIKGRDFHTRFEHPVALGIELHRLIDAFTDEHPLVKASKDRLRPKYRHYAAVIVDIFYDHYLAKNWAQFHSMPLADFADQSYAIINAHHAILPEETRYMLPYMVNHNWLVSYATGEGIQRALSGMSRRTSFQSRMDEATHELTLYHKEFEQEFMGFFPRLSAYAQNIIRDRSV